MYHFKETTTAFRPFSGANVGTIDRISYEYVGPTEDDDPKDGQAILFDINKKLDGPVLIGKCSFVCEGRSNHIMHKYFEEEEAGSEQRLLIDAKIWFGSHLKLVKDIACQACETFVELAYINNYSQAIADLECNNFVHLDEGFYIEFFIIPFEKL
jgi:hypothetical protein